jgi:hypothetical protein
MSQRRFERRFCRSNRIDIEIAGSKEGHSKMGILTQQQGSKYVISSDQASADAPSKRPPKGKPMATYEVWTGETWSASGTDATIFNSLDAADQYVKENYARLSAKR